MKKLLMAMVLAPMMTLAYEWTDPATGIKWSYVISGNTATVCSGVPYESAIPAPTGGEIVIPEKLGGKPVTGIGPYAFYGCGGLTSVTIPDGVETFGEYAFHGCGGLESVTIPSGVTSVGDSAFSNCGGLKSVVIPLSVTSIGEYAFYGCAGLGTVTIPSGVRSIGKLAFCGCSGLETDVPSGVTAVGNGAFNSCKRLSVAPSNAYFTMVNDLLCDKSEMTVISCANGLSSVTIPATVTSIGLCAFEGCAKLESVKMPADLTSIWAYAFYGCSGLKSVTIPPNVTNVGEFAFCDCSGLGSVTIPTNVRSIDSFAFSRCSGLTSVTISEGVTSIGGTAFSDCVGLKSVAIPSSVTNIGASAFSGCVGLTAATIPASVTSIGSCAFFECGRFEAEIPSGVTSIGGGAFNLCKKLTVASDSSNFTMENGLLCDKSVTTVISCPGTRKSVVIPPAVTIIGDSAFYGCSGLTSVSLPSGLTSFGKAAFSGCRELKFVTIPSGVTSIGASAFSDCSVLKSVRIPKGVTNIENSVCSGCSGLTSVTIPSGVTRIGASAFSGCSGLTSIRIPKGVTNIEYSVCSGCSGLTSVTIPSGVTSIAKNAFYGCRGLVSVTIPKSVTSVGLNAFGGCSSLKTVYIGKTGDVDRVKRMLAMSGIDFSVVTVDRSDGPLVAVAASVYDGWISDANGLVIGSVQVKVAKGKKDRSTGVFSAKVTASVQLADGSGKISFRGGTVDSTGVVTEMTDKKGHRLEVVLGARALGGAFDGVCQLDGARNVFSGKSSEDKTAAAAALPYQDSYNVAFGGGTLSVAVGKKGKTKVSGTVDGVKVSAQSQLVVGDGVTGVPVVIARKKARLAFCLRLAEDGGAEVAGIDPGRYIKDADPLPAGKAGAIADDARLVLDAEAVDKLQGWFPGLYLDCLPKSVGVAQDGKKWVVAAGAKAGKLVLVKGTTEIDSEKSAFTDNMSGLKLSYRPKDGSFRGSFKIFALEKGKIRSYVATVTGLMIGQKGYGTAAVKKLGTVAVAIVGKEGAQ